jgi:hypothetical protein
LGTVDFAKQLLVVLDSARGLWIQNRVFRKEDKLNFMLMLFIILMNSSCAVCGILLNRYVKEGMTKGKFI